MDEKLTELITKVAVLITRVDAQAIDIDELKEQFKWAVRLIITTLLTLLIGVALGVFGVLLAL